MDIIDVKGLSFSYHSALVLEDINFTTKQGDFTAIIGPNGGGKTTLTKLILGLQHAICGQVKLWGMAQSDFKDFASIGYLEQKTSPPVIMPITAFEVVKLGLLSSKKYPRNFTDDDTGHILKTMQTADCLDFKDQLFNNLSGGQQQRILLARALINNPKLLILDEPSTALDSLTRRNFFELITRLNKENGTTILLITHDSAEVGKYVNKFLLIDKKIIFYGDKQAFCDSSAVADYMGPYNQHIIDHLHTHKGCPFHHKERL